MKLFFVFFRPTSNFSNTGAFRLLAVSVAIRKCLWQVGNETKKSNIGALSFIVDPRTKTRIFPICLAIVPEKDAIHIDALQSDSLC